MRQTFNVLFFIRKTRALKSGENPIMLRISIAGQLTKMQLKRAVKPNLWNQSKERCTGKDAASVEIKRKFLGLDEEHKMFFQVFQEHNDKCRELIGKEYAKVTVSRFDTCLKYFQEMSLKQYQRKDIPLKELSNGMILDYIHFLKSEKGLQENSVIHYMKTVKKVLNIAVNYDWIQKNPFGNVRFHEREVNKEFLTKEELERLRTKTFDIPRLELVRDVFLVQCWTGLAFIDVSDLKKEHLVPDNEGNLWIRKERQKTGIMCNVPLLDVPLDIIEICAELRRICPRTPGVIHSARWLR